MIASNYRRFPEAMALQLVLVFGRCTWHTARPTTRIGRAVRAERSRLVKQTPQVVRWVAKSVPAWWKEAQRAAKALAKQVKAAMLALVWDADADASERPDFDEWMRRQKLTSHDSLDSFWETAHLRGCHLYAHGVFTEFHWPRRRWKHLLMAQSSEASGYDYRD